MTGACFCGKLKVKVTGAPLSTVCHCESCRIWTGTYAMNMVIFPRPNVTLDMGDGGAILEHSRTHKENNPASRKCCADCGTALFVDYGGKVALVSFSLFPDAKFPLQGHICTPEAQYCSMADVSRST